MNICTIRIADPIPPGETSVRAIIFATASAGFVYVPRGGKGDTVLIFADQFRLFVAAIGSTFAGLGLMHDRRAIRAPRLRRYTRAPATAPQGAWCHPERNGLDVTGSDHSRCSMEAIPRC